MRKILLSMALLWVTTSLWAQEASEAGLFLGLSTYQGDLVDAPFDANETNFAIGLQYRSMFSPKWGIKAGLNFGKISGTDLDAESRDARGASMESNLVEIAAQLEWHLLGEPTSPNRLGTFSRTFSPYIGLGLGMVFSNQTVTAIDNLMPEEDTGSFIILPVDLGLRLNLSPSLTSTLSIGSRATFSDLLDGISANGNADADDWYLIGGISFLYAFN